MGERAKDLSSRREKQQYMALSGWMDTSKPSFWVVVVLWRNGILKVFILFSNHINMGFKSFKWRKALLVLTYTVLKPLNSRPAFLNALFLFFLEHCSHFYSFNRTYCNRLISYHLHNIKKNFSWNQLAICLPIVI